MAYSSPSGNAVDFELSGGYTVPSGNAVDFEMAPTTGAQAEDVTAGTPVVGSVSASITFGIVSADDVSTGDPSVDSITATSISVAPISVVAGIPDVGRIVVSSASVAPVPVISGAPVAPDVAVSITAAKASTQDVYAGAPMVPNISVQNVIAVPVGVVSGAPVVPGILILVGAGRPLPVTSGTPDVGSIAVRSIGAAVPDVTAGTPLVPGVVVVSMSVNVVAQDVVTGPPAVGSPVVSRYGANISDVTTGVPAVGAPVAVSLTARPVPPTAGVPDVPVIGGLFFPLITENSVLVYICTLTGDTDVEIPITSFQGRLRSGAETYLSVVIPGLDFASEITERADGQIVIEAAYLVSGDIRQRSEIVRVNLGSIRIDEGILSSSITLTGYRQETYIPKSIELKGSTYKSYESGYRVRFSEPNLDLNPGDIVTVGNDTFEASVVSYVVRVGGGTADTNMEVSES